MENLYNNTNYKSGWKPMVREDDSTVLSTYKKAESSNNKNSSSINSTNIAAEENKKPAETVSVLDNSEVLKILAELSTRLDTLDARIAGQSETLNSLLLKTESVLDKSKKSIFSKK